MHTVTFLGHVHPRGFLFDLLNIPRFEFQDNSSELEGFIEVDFHQSDIVARVQFNIKIYQYELILYSKVMILCRAMLNLYSIMNGFAIYPVIETILDSNMERRDLVFQNTKIADLNLSLSSLGDIKGALAVAIKHPTIMIALKDVFSSLLELESAFINCARAIEVVRNIISVDVTAQQGWQNMRDALNLDEGYLRYISDSSKDFRHGRYPQSAQHDIDTVVQRTIIIMYRFLYLKSQDLDALPIDSFPTLQG